ncbi:uncharacterized protein LOC133186757 [Saccostrea echinata]|uniref:uncharacterized protein LOC133186757 n=1 Tax=Saccostrea echinata TaxID=191078 RepID=UPI002A824272|nr:uncharacterized protein LOC133186757 [Saccostrea echinata]
MFLVTKSCPRDVRGWKTRGKNFNCSNPNEVYHCLPDENGRLGETCTKGPAGWVEKDFCPEYNRDTNDVNTVPCHISTDCPDEAFKTNEVYKYPVCLQGSSSAHDGGTSSLPWHIIGVAVGVIALLVVFSVVALICYRKRRRRTSLIINL